MYSNLFEQRKKVSPFMKGVSMFGMEYILALSKIAFNLAFAIVTAIPTVFCWNCIAPKYLTFLPEIYLNIPYWHIMAIIFLCTVVGEQIKKLCPKLVSVSQSNS